MHEGQNGHKKGGKCKRKKTERIIKTKLAKRVKDKYGKGDTSVNPLELNDSDLISFKLLCFNLVVFGWT